MIGHRGAQLVKGGTYWSLSTGEFVTVPAEGGELPGSSQTYYLKMRLPAMMVVGPLAGLFYVIFLPLAGILVVASFMGYQGWRGVRAIGRTLLQLASSPQWKPGTSYLAKQRRQRVEKAARPEKGEGPLAELERQIAEKRREEEERR